MCNNFDVLVYYSYSLLKSSCSKDHLITVFFSCFVLFSFVCLFCLFVCLFAFFAFRIQYFY